MPGSSDRWSETSFEVEITLLGSRPRIWRTVRVPAAITLADLHRVIQRTMGWTDAHLHAFVTWEGVGYGAKAPELEPDPREVDERRGRLHQVLRLKSRPLSYEYDFGDGWQHRIRLLGIAPIGPDDVLPVCTGGDRACPPEDCGGTPGYARLRRILRNPGSREYEAMRRWAGPGFDPAHFDLDEVNRKLAPLQRRFVRARERAAGAGLPPAAEP